MLVYPEGREGAVVLPLTAAHISFKSPVETALRVQLVDAAEQ
jgi:hypothetical protein